MAARVLVVVPVWNNRSLTIDCLESLAREGARTSFEIAVVDNGSNDGVEDDLRRLSDSGLIHLVRNASNLGYARATNQGVAAVADTEFVLLLNNDTLALPGWLDGLVDDLDRHPEADVAGSLLVYGDRTTIQHAGMVAGRIRGRLLMFHRWQFRTLQRTPEALRAGEVDAVTGASLLVRRRTFESVGGLSERYVNGFEDSDFCWKVSTSGRKIRYVPSSRLVHLESRTPGRRRMEEANARLFQATWGHLAVETSEDFHRDLRELRLRRRLEHRPDDPLLLRPLLRLVEPRHDGEAESLRSRIESSPSPRWKKSLARLLS